VLVDELRRSEHTWHVGNGLGDVMEPIGPSELVRDFHPSSIGVVRQVFFENRAENPLRVVVETDTSMVS
jgi:hypothetical protein